jgi:hypothetical protein
MIDALLGMALLLMLSGWMASLVSVQSMLSSPARNLSQREQLDYLNAVKQSNSSLQCSDLIEDAALISSNLVALQELLVASTLLQRPDGVSIDQQKEALRTEGQLPLTTKQEQGWILDPSKLLQVSSEDQSGTLVHDPKAIGGGDWFLRLSDVDSKGKHKMQRLFVCP